MKYNHIQRFLSAALLLAFTAPSSLTASAYDSASLAPYTSSMVLSGDVKLTPKNDKITLSLRDSDVKQVLRMFADKAGLNVVFHSSVDGKVTLDLVDMPINDAFNLVLQVAGLNYYTQNNTMVVIAKDNADNASFSKQEMMVFPVKYVSAAKIADFLNKNVFGMKKAGLSSVDAATVNTATNEIIVFGMESDAAIVQKVIEQLDREPLTKTFAVNHTTPAEMANMICEMLLPSRGSSSSENSSGGFMPPTPGMGTTGGAAGIMTGGAASSASAGGGSSDELKLGEGIVACTVAPTASSSTSAPFDVQNLSVSYFPQRGTITLMGGSEAQINMVESFIKANDVKQPQAYLEVSIVELTEDGIKEFSNNWAIDTKNWFVSFNGTSTQGGRQSSPGSKEFIPVQVIGPDGQLSDEYRTREQWYGSNAYISWTMNYIIESRKGRVLANPKLLITNGQTSIIDLTQDYVEKVTSEFLSSTGAGVGAIGTSQRTYSIGSDLGIKVELVPFISPDGYVTLNIKPEYSTIASQVTTPSETGEGNDLQATLLSRRNLDLKNVRIKDGETLVIGGLIQEKETKTISKVPVLGDLPIIGAAFRSSRSEKSKNELIIMLTPKIINDGEGSVADSL